MPGARTKPDIYAAHGKSLVQRIVLTAAIACCVAGAWWLLAGEGIRCLGGWFGWRWSPGSQARRLILAVALSIYFVRLLFTQFVFLKRAMRWGESCLIALWAACIYLLLAIAGGSNRAAMGWVGAAGIALFLFGSWMNTYSEYTRYRWKQDPRNHERLYTSGLFRYTRHPNYLGDVISFTGLCLISGRWLTGLIPLIMLAGFIFANIPLLDLHLHEHYGAEFDRYATRTRKLIPFLY